MNSLFLCESSFCSHKLKKFTPLHQFHNHQNPGTVKTGLEIPPQLKHLTRYYPFSMYPVFVSEDLILVALPQPTLYTIVNWRQADKLIKGFLLEAMRRTWASRNVLGWEGKVISNKLRAVRLYHCETNNSMSSVSQCLIILTLCIFQ